MEGASAEQAGRGGGIGQAAEVRGGRGRRGRVWDNGITKLQVRLGTRNPGPRLLPPVHHVGWSVSVLQYWYPIYRQTPKAPSDNEICGSRNQTPPGNRNPFRSTAVAKIQASSYFIRGTPVQAKRSPACQKGKEGKRKLVPIPCATSIPFPFRHLVGEIDNRSGDRAKGSLAVR